MWKKVIEEPISYVSWLEGEWQIEKVIAWGGTPVSAGWDMVQSYVGTNYDFSELSDEKPSGGVVPIRDMELQPFFHGRGICMNWG